MLASKAKEIISKQFSLLCRNQEFLSLPADKLVEIISDDNIEVSQEETVYEACMDWVKCDVEARSEHLGEIMNVVRFANISSYYFCDRIDNNGTLKECTTLRETLDSVKYYHMLR